MGHAEARRFELSETLGQGVVEVGGLDGEGRAGGVVDEAFCGGAQEEGFEAGAPTGAEDDEVRVHVFEGLPDPTVNAVGGDDFRGDFRKLVLLGDPLGQFLQLSFEVVLNDFVGGDWEGWSKPTHFRFGENGWAINVDELEPCLVLTGKRGGTMHGPVGILGKVDASHDVFKRVILVVSDKQDFDRGFANAAGCEGPDVVAVVAGVATGSENEGLGVVLFDLIERGFERVSENNFGGDFVCGADGFADEPCDFFVSKIQDALFGFGVHFFDLVQDFLVENVEADQRQFAGVGHARSGKERVFTLSGIVDTNEDG